MIEEGFSIPLPNMVGILIENGKEVAIPSGEYFVYTVLTNSLEIESPLGIIRVF